MLRLVANFIMMICLLLSIALAALAIRSRGVADQLTWKGAASTTIITSTRGRIEWEMKDVSTRPSPPVDWELLRWSTTQAYSFYDPAGTSWGGFSVRSGDEPMYAGIVHVTRVRVTHLGLCVMLLVFPVGCVMARLIRRASRLRRGCCAACGYDLRGSAAACPECGTTPRRQPVQ